MDSSDSEYGSDEEDVGLVENGHVSHEQQRRPRRLSEVRQHQKEAKREETAYLTILCCSCRLKWIGMAGGVGICVVLMLVAASAGKSGTVGLLGLFLLTMSAGALLSKILSERGRMTREYKLHLDAKAAIKAEGFDSLGDLFEQLQALRSENADLRERERIRASVEYANAQYEDGAATNNEQLRLANQVLSEELRTMHATVEQLQQRAAGPAVRRAEPKALARTSTSQSEADVAARAQAILAARRRDI